MLILPSLSREQAQSLIDRSEDGRNEAMIALFAESGLKLRELTDIKLQDVDWDNRTIRVSGEGNKDGYAPLGACPSNGVCTYRSISGIIEVKASEGGTDEQGVSPL